jgi:hypothetical protein
LVTALVSKVSQQYEETFRTFVNDEDRMRSEWNETVQELGQLDPTNPTDLISAYGHVQALEGILFPAIANNGKSI